MLRKCSIPLYVNAVEQSAYCKVCALITLRLTLIDMNRSDISGKTRLRGVVKVL